MKTPPSDQKDIIDLSGYCKGRIPFMMFKVWLLIRDSTRQVVLALECSTKSIKSNGWVVSFTRKTGFESRKDVWLLMHWWLSCRQASCQLTLLSLVEEHFIELHLAPFYDFVSWPPIVYLDNHAKLLFYFAIILKKENMLKIKIRFECTYFTCRTHIVESCIKIDW